MSEAPMDEVRGYLDAWSDGEKVAVVNRAMFMGALRDLREATGLSLRDAARAASISPASLSLAERGDLDLSWPAAYRLLNALEAARKPAAPRSPR